MKKSFVWSAVLVLILACDGSRPGEDGVGTTSVAATDSTASVEPGNVASIVQVEFDGTMSFVFPENGKTPRVAVFKGGHHPHTTVIILPPDIKGVAEADRETHLETITGGRAICDDSACFVQPDAELAMQIVDGGGGAVQNSPVDKDSLGLFQKLVPKLRTLSKDWGSAEIAALDPKITEDVPETDNEHYNLFVHLNGGILSAKAACGTAAYKKHDNPSSMSAYAKFADSVVLTGTTPTAAKVQFKRAGQDWTDVGFDAATFLHILVLNVPRNGGSDHFELHAKVGQDKGVKLPKLDHKRDCETNDRRMMVVELMNGKRAFREPYGNVIGCSASTWP